MLRKQEPKEQRKVLARWVKQTKAEDRQSRLEAIILVARMASESKVVRDALAEALRDKDHEVRYIAVKALSHNAVLQVLFKMGVKGLPVLAEIFRNDQGASSGQHIMAELAKAPNTFGVDAIPVFSEMLHKDDRAVKGFAAIGLAKVGPPAIPALTEALKDHDKEVRYHAAWAFLLMGSEAKPALSALKEALRDSYAGDGAAVALARIGPEGVSVLVEALRDKDTCSRSSALWGLGAGHSSYAAFYVGPGATVLGPEVRKAIPDLIDTLRERGPDSRKRSCAAIALGRIGSPAKAAVPQLIECLRDEELRVSPSALWDKLGRQPQRQFLLLENSQRSTEELAAPDRCRALS